MYFNDWLKEQLDRRKLTRFEFCTTLKIASPTLTLWILGDRYPNIKNRRKIVEALSEGNQDLRTKLILDIWDLDPCPKGEK